MKPGELLIILGVLSIGAFTAFSHFSNIQLQGWRGATWLALSLGACVYGVVIRYKSKTLPAA